MNAKMKNVLLGATIVGTLILAVAGTATAWAKDTYYYIGYGLIQIVDGDSDAIVGEIPVEGWLRETDFSADDKFLYVTANRHLIHKIDLASRQVVHTIDVAGGGWDRFIFGFDLAPDGKTAWVNLLSRKTHKGDVIIGKPMLAQIDLSDGKIIRSIEVPWGSATIVSVKDSSQIYVIGKDIVKVDVAAEEMHIIGEYPMFEKQWNILPLWDNSRENNGVFIVNYYTPELMGLLSIDTTSGEITATPLEGPPVFAYSVMRSPDKKKVYAVMDELTVIDMATASYESITMVPNGTNYAINVSSDGKKIYVAGGGATTTVFDAQSQQAIKVLQMETDGMDFRRVTQHQDP